MKSLYILGTAKYGKTGESVKVTSEAELIETFGDRGSLINSYRMCTEKNIDLHLVKINGSSAKAYLNILNSSSVVEDKVLLFESKYSNEEFNGITIILKDDYLKIVENEKEFYYSFEDYYTLESLIMAINYNSSSGISSVVVTNLSDEKLLHPAEAIVSCNKEISILQGGNSGLSDTNNEIYFSLKFILEDLLGTQMDCIVLSELYLDTPLVPLETVSSSIELNFGYLLLDFIVLQEKLTIITKAVIGFSPIKEKKPITVYKEYINKINNYLPEHHKKYYSLMSITFGDVFVKNRSVIENHAIPYAVKFCSSKLITNEPYTLDCSSNDIHSLNEIESIKDISIIARDSILTGKTHILDGISLSKSTILSNDPIVSFLQELYKEIPKITDKYIGEIVKNNSIDTVITSDIKRYLTEKATDSILKSYTVSAKDIDYSKTIIYIELMFYGQLKPYTVSLSLLR